MGETLQVESKNMRIYAGINGLNTLIENGIPKGYSVILQTPSGPERDLFVAGFIKEGIQSEDCVIVTLSMNSPDEFKIQLGNFGLTKEKMEEYESKGKLRILDWYSFKNERIQGIEELGSIIKCSKALTNVEIAINKILRGIEGKSTRAIMDVLSPALKVFDFETVYKFAQTIRAKFKKEGVTALFIIDRDMHESRTLSSLHRVFDGVIDIERERIGNKLSSKLGILSMSGTFFVPEYRELKLTKEGLEIIPSQDEKKVEDKFEDKIEVKLEDDTIEIPDEVVAPPIRAREMRRQLPEENGYMELDIGLDNSGVGGYKEDEEEMIKALSVFSSVLNPKVKKEYAGEKEEIEMQKGQINAYKEKGYDVSYLQDALKLDAKLRQKAFDDFADFVKKTEALDVELEELERSGRVSEEPYKSDVSAIRATLKIYDKFSETQERLSELKKKLEEKLHASKEEKKKALEAYIEKMEKWRKEGYNVSVLEKALKGDFDTISVSFSRYEKFIKISEELNDKLSKMDIRGMRVNAAMIKAKLKDYEKISEVVKDFADLVAKAKSMKEKKEENKEKN